MTVLSIIGAGGHGKVVADAAIASGEWSQIKFYDDSYPSRQNCLDFSIAGTVEDLISSSDSSAVIVAVGNNLLRINLIHRLKNCGFRIATIVHPSAVISRYAKVGEGSVVFAGAIINANASVGIGCIVNTRAVIEHDCNLDYAVHISPAAALAGGVKVGALTWIGIGAAVIQGIDIGENCIIGAGASVINDIPANLKAVGVPAKIMNSKR